MADPETEYVPTLEALRTKDLNALVSVAIASASWRADRGSRQAGLLSAWDGALALRSGTPECP